MAQVQLIIEVEEDFKENLKALAKAEDRTLRATVIRLLNQAIAASEAKG
jgi:predicted transcriptional regulator